MLKIRTCLINIIFFLIIIYPSTIIAENTETEFHVVSTYSGKKRVERDIEGPQIDIQVNRPNKKITLMLGSYHKYDWHIELSNNSKIDKIILFGHNARQSNAYINNQLFKNTVKDQNLHYIANEKSVHTKNLIDYIWQKFGHDRINSISISKNLDKLVYIFQDSKEEKPWLSRNYLEKSLSETSILPIKFVRTHDSFKQNSREFFKPKAIMFTEQGFVLNLDGSGSSSILLPINESVPAINWPVGAAYDKKNNALYGVTLGGEGYIYKFDLNKSKWSILSSMDGFDAGSIKFDDKSRLFMLGGGISRTSSSTILSYDVKLGEKKKYQFSLDNFIGYSDLYDPDSGPAPLLEIIDIYKDKILLMTKPGSFNNNPDVVILPQRWRLYQVDLETKKVHLVDYSN